MELALLLLLVCVAFSWLFSGSEIGFYSVSRVRVELSAHAGHRTARWMQALLRNDSALLITILIGNNLAIELATHEGERLLEALPVWPGARELVVTALLTPVLFFFGEILPKELFRRRPYALLTWTVPVVYAARFVFLPLERVLYGVTWLLQRLLRVEEGALRRSLDRERVLELMRESDDVAAPAEDLAHNVLRLRGIKLASVMVPWERVRTLTAGEPEEQLYASVASSGYSRLPVWSGGEVSGYVLQLDVLARGPGEPVLQELRPLEFVPADTPLPRALARMRLVGLRALGVGEPAQPVGWVTLKDLLEEISGDLADW